MSTVTSLGAFLRQRRSLLHPDPALDRMAPAARRVSGLRREEVARRAGISTGYYTRLEQGKDHRTSPEVIAALARALRLDVDETRHLLELSTPGSHSTDEIVRPSTRSHPTLGDIELDDQLLLLPDDPGQRLVVWTRTRTD